MPHLKIRSKLSREWRRTKKNNETEEIQKACRERYFEQKKVTAIMTAKKKRDWEKKKIEETKNDGKKFWGMIKELLGKNKEKEEEKYVQTQDEVRK